MNIGTLVGCVGDISCLTTQLVNAVVMAMILFLVASGLSLVFGVLNIANFAHGSLYMAGAYLTYTMVSSLGSVWLAMFLVPISVGLLGIFIEVTLFRRIYGSPPLYQFLLAFGLLLMLDDIARYIWGFTFKSIGIPPVFQRPPIFFFGSPVPLYYAFVICVSAMVALGIWLLLSQTRFGKMITAAALDPQTVETLGINVRLLYSMVFGLGAALAGFGGFLALPIRSATPGMGFSILMESFIVMTVGGVGSIGGALVSALLVGLMRSFGTIGFPDFEIGFSFFLVIVILIFRPWGLFGKPLEQ